MLEIIPEKLNFPQLITYSEICHFPKVSNFPWCVFPILFVIEGVNDLSEKFDLKTNKSHQKYALKSTFLSNCKFSMSSEACKESKEKLV